MDTTGFMELELGLALPNQTPISQEKRYKSICNKYIHQNPRFDDHVCGDDDDDDGDEVESNDLSLLLWSGQPNENDDEKWRRRHVDDVKSYNEENQEIVGWPPIHSSAGRELARDQGGGVANNNSSAAMVERVVLPVRNSLYVKVKMEGVPIGRKIDLRRYDSYQALTGTLINMFAKYTEKGNRDGDYTMLYQDKEGDWMLAGDVPWEIFVQSVKRMKILRNAK